MKLTMGLAILAVAVPAFSDPRWPSGKTIPVWIEGSAYSEMVRRALATWSWAGEGAFSFQEVSEPPAFGIQIRFDPEEGRFGEARPHYDPATGNLARSEIELSLDRTGDPMQRSLVVYLTALHEVGHALGLKHTDNDKAIMYRFHGPGEPQRYFARYRRELRSISDIGSERAPGLYPSDVQALQRLYPP